MRHSQQMKRSIEGMRYCLNNAIEQNKDYLYILRLSQQLDSMITDYHLYCKKHDVKAMQKGMAVIA